MDSDIAYFVTYPCPRCKVELESEHGGWQGWLRCPACGMPALPPEILLGHPTTRRRVRETLDDDVLIIADDAAALDGVAPPDPSILIGPPVSSLVTTLRLIFLAGLVMSLFLLLIGYLDQNQRATAIFGSLSIVCFLLLLRTSGRRPKYP